MVEVRENNAIFITRGDSAELPVAILYDDDTEYIPVQGDTIRFALKRFYTDKEPVLVKDIPISTMELKLDPEDTKDLKSGPICGLYKYDVELTTSDGFVATFISKADFTVLEEVN